MGCRLPVVFTSIPGADSHAAECELGNLDQAAAIIELVEIDSVPENDAAAVRTTVEPPPAVEVCGNRLDDDGNLLTDFEDPACCGSAAGLIAKRLRIVPRKGLHALALAGQLPAGAGNPPAEDLVLQTAAIEHGRGRSGEAHRRPASTRPAAPLAAASRATPR